MLSGACSEFMDPTTTSSIPELPPAPAAISGASVKVMRSHDYCHFEIQLSTTEATTPSAIDALRKEAARLVDKAVAQYKIAKREFAEEERDAEEMRWKAERIRAIGKKPARELTPGEMAELKEWQDRLHEARNRERRSRYDYEDEWDETGPEEGAY